MSLRLTQSTLDARGVGAAQRQHREVRGGQRYQAWPCPQCGHETEAETGASNWYPHVQV